MEIGHGQPTFLLMEQSQTRIEQNLIGDESLIDT
jgi:hypothetical protein